MPHHLDRQRSDLPRPRLRDRRALAAVEVRLGQVEQQIDHPLAARRLGDQRATAGPTPFSVVSGENSGVSGS